MVWTLFWDMYSGGRTKVKPYDKIYIEASEPEARVIFYNRFGRNPEHVTCPCCGPDYSISEKPTLEEASAYHRDLSYIEDVRGWRTKAADKKEVRYLEIGEAIPDGYKLSDSAVSMAKYKKPKTLAEYAALESVLIVRASDIKDNERV